jgi:FAD/FMN-containing dehydrogenases
MDVLDHLQAELGDAVSEDAAALDAVRRDRSGWVADGTPLALVNARSTADVQATMRIASEYRIPVVPRGAGTGLAGGANGTDGSIVLSVAGMNRVLEISAADEFAVVQPGVINNDLDAALAEHGLWFAPDPASKAISSIGGNIATNAGGLLCVKYGVTREAVLGLTAVLADGRVLTTGHRTVKGVTGYDMTSLFVGSEGTFGVIVDATVRVLPRPEGETTTIGAFLPDIRSAAAAGAAITAARLRPAVLELMDALSLRAIRDHLGAAVLNAAIGVDVDAVIDAGGAYLLVQFDAGTGEHAGERAVDAIVGAGGTPRITTDADEGEALLAIRRSSHAALSDLGEVLIEDVAVPRSKMPEMFEAIAEISARHGVPIPTIAHAGDGNLHPNFVHTGPEVPERVWQAAGELFQTALRLGGTLTGEHGVGMLKRRWLRDELGDDSYCPPTPDQRGVRPPRHPQSGQDVPVTFVPNTAGAAQPSPSAPTVQAGAWTPPLRPEPRRATVVLTIIGLVVLAQLLFWVFAYLASAIGVASVIGCGLLALVPLAIVLLAVHWIDRWDPEPIAARWFAFLWGAAAAVSIALIIDLGAQLVDAVNGSAPAGQFFASVVRAPLVEETAKGLGVLLIYVVARRSFDGPVDGIVYAATVAAGFAFVENITYFGSALVDSGGEGLATTFVLRGLLSPFAHVMFTSCTGFALGLAARRSGALRTATYFIGGLLSAMLLHALWNSAAYLGGDFWGFYLVVQVPLFVIAVAFVVALRRRERGLTHDRLSDYARVGWFSSDEVRMLSTPRGRRHALAWARRRPHGRAIMKRFVQDATHLAWVRQRIVSGNRVAQARVDESALLASIAAERDALARLG